MKKNNTAEKAALDAEKITKALQESTEKSLKDIINEAIKKVVKEDDEIEDPEDNSYDVEDVEPNETPEVSDVETGEETGGEEGGEEEPAEEPAEEPESDEADDDWSDMEQYKVGDDDYDFTGVDGDEILKVYNKLGDDDQIFVKKEDDGTYSVKDDETGAEFVIELNPEKLDAENDGEGEADEFDFEGGEEPSDEPDFDLDVDVDGGEEEAPEDDDEIEIDINDDEDDDEELNEENLGYTDSYQKDVFDKKFNMNEPADGKTTYSMDAGAPKGAEKPWAGKGDPKPFGAKKDTVDEEVDECGGKCVVPGQETNLEENGSGFNTLGREEKVGPYTGKGRGAARRAHSENGEYKGTIPASTNVNESIKKIVAKAKAIQAENKQYKDNLDRIKKALYEAAVLNVNMGRLVDILVNETTTRDEKKSILERFNTVKTINEGKILHAAIKAELSESKKSAPIVEKQFVAGKENLNETTIYSNMSNPSLDLMNRMDNLYTK